MYNSNITTGLKYSLLLHAIIILNIFIYVYKSSDAPVADRIISVELVNIKSGPTTNLKNTPVKSIEKPASKDPSVVPAAKPVVQNRPNEMSKPAEIKQQVPSKEVPHHVEHNDADKILSKLENLSVDKTASKNKSTNYAMSDKPYDRTKPIMIADYDNIRMQIEKKFFNPVVTDFQPGEVVIRIKVNLKSNGEVEKVTVLNTGAYSAKHLDVFSTLRDSLVRAVHMASPLKGLSADSYESWGEIELVFDAHRLMHFG